MTFYISARCLLATLFSTAVSFSTFGKSGERWAADGIPAQLAGAHAVVRLSEQEVRVVAPDKVVIREHLVITILDAAGKEHSGYQATQSKLNEVRTLGGTLYDRDGKVVSKARAGDFVKLPAPMVTDMYTDLVLKAHMFSYSNYPYTVEYTSEQEQKHTFLLPSWQPQPAPDVAVETATLQVTAPDDFAIRHKALNTAAAPAVTNDRTDHVYSWKLQGLKAFRAEPLEARPNGGMPEILLAPGGFTLGTLSGSMASWKDFGSFVYRLNQGRSTLPGEVSATVRQLTGKETDVRRKIDILYRYLQQHTRYVSVQYGIGGWQTLDAAFLAHNQFGDCKGLSNYMMALLDAAGITGYPVLISAGDEHYVELFPDFPATMFNHEILCVPLAKDTVWLECTSNTLPSGYLTDFTHNRRALMVTPNGGVPVRTPAYDTSVNIVHRNLKGLIDGENRCNMKVDIRLQGNSAHYVEETVKDKSGQDIRDYLEHKFSLASYTFENYHFRKEEDASVTAARESLDLSVAGNATVTGSRMFINMDFAPADMPALTAETERAQPFTLHHARKTVDTFRLKMPQDMEIESLPAPVVLKQPFGSYACAISRQGDELVLVRQVALMYGTYPADQYASFVAWMDKVNDERHKKVVLKRK